MAEILTKEAVRKYNFDNKVSRTIKVYNTHGDSMFSLNRNHEIRTLNGRQIRRTISKGSPVYVGSAKHNEILNRMEHCLNILHANGIRDVKSFKANISHYPAGAEELFDLMRMDITAKILEFQDLTGFIANVIQNDNFTNPTNAQWLYEYVAPFKEITGRGDRVPLVQIKTGEKESIYFTIDGVGFEMDLYNELFNDIFAMQKVTSAVAKGYILKKNDIVFAPIFAFNYGASKIVNPETNYTYEQNIYDTLQLAIQELGDLKDFQTGAEIDVNSGLTLICHSTRVRAINRAINGQLRNGAEVKNLNAITEIAKIIPYNTQRQRYGNEDIEYTGCAQEEAYLLVPKKYFYLALKRDLTHITGPGDTFGITSEKEAWYFCHSVLHTQFFGGDAEDEASSTDPTVMTQEHGYIVQITLPTLSEPET
jgi:hypothetical protein